MSILFTIKKKLKLWMKLREINLNNKIPEMAKLLPKLAKKGKEMGDHIVR